MAPAVTPTVTATAIDPLAGVAKDTTVEMEMPPAQPPDAQQATDAADALHHAHQQGVILVEERHVLCKLAVEVFLNGVVIGLGFDPGVSFQHAGRVGVNHERGHVPGVEQDRIGSLGANARNAQQLFAEFG